MSMYPIAVATGTGAAGSFSFTSIPQTFTHLQLRIYGRSYQANNTVYTYFNGDAASTNYPQHQLYGTGAAVYSSGAASQPYMQFPYWVAQSTDLANAYSNVIIDVLDYTNTNKNKTVRAIAGYDINGSGYAGLYSAAWLSTAAITSWTLTPGFSTGSVAVLYGITTSNATGA